MYVIYDDYNVNEKDYLEEFKESGLADFDDFIINELFNQYQETFNHDLDINLNSDIICIANLGFWNCRTTASKILSPNIGKSITRVFSDDEIFRKIYVEDDEVKAIGYHHDNHHNYLFRVIKDTALLKDVRALEQLIKDGKDYTNLLNKCTESIAPTVNKVYGWN